VCYCPGVRASIVVLNWNGAGYVAECLDAALAQKLEGGIEVVVVDNGSTDGSRALVRTYVPRIRLLENAHNVGFAAGCNQAFRAAKGDLLLLLNADAVPEPGWAAALVRAAEAGGRVGLVASKVLGYDDPGTLDGTGHLLWPDGLNRARGRGEPDDGRYDDAREVFFPSGAAMLARRGVVDETGGFDERFFAYGDDTDLGLHARWLGWDCAYAPDARVRHRYSAATGAHSAFKLYHVERNRIWLAVKYLPWTMLAAVPLWTLARIALHAAGAARGRGVLDGYGRDLGWRVTAATLARAWWDGLRGVPAMLRTRRRVRESARIGDAELRAMARRWRLRSRAIAVID